MTYLQRTARLPDGQYPDHPNLTKGWDQIWKDGQISWDKGQPAPALVTLINSGKLPTIGNVLVPGCGTGYDLLLFASSNPQMKAFGIDISPTAVEAAKNLLKTTAVDKSRVEYICGSFFDYSFTVKFDIVYDYTFFCAIDPSKRNDWARVMAESIVSGGILITLMFPIGTHTEGPPFAVQPDHYHAVLDANFTLVSLTDNEESFEARVGKEKVGVWKRK